MDWYEQQQELKPHQQQQQFHLLTNFVKWFPVSFVASILVWSYYVFVVKICILELESGSSQQLFFLTLYHIISMMLVISFVKTIFSPPGIVPDNWKLSQQMTDTLSKAKTEDEWMSYLELFILQMGVAVYQRSAQVNTFHILIINYVMNICSWETLVGTKYQFFNVANRTAFILFTF